MAENQGDRSTEDLSEEASSYRLEEARNKGQVAQSRELAGMLSLLGVGVAVYSLGPSMATQLGEYMQEAFRADLTARLNFGDNAILGQALMKMLKVIIAVSLPVCAIGAVIGLLASIVQVGSVFSADPIQPDFSKLDPIKGLQKMFSMRQLTEAARVSFKAAIVGYVAYEIIYREIVKAPTAIGQDANTTMALMGHAAWGVFLSLIAILLLFSLVDFFLQRREFMKGMRLTKQEAKQEHKEREGDPAIKARIRSVQREVARRRMMQAVRKADVIITNPTHIAIAVVYDRDKMAAPRVVAKGADFLAQKIKKVAGEAGVPIVENVPLARTLFKSVKIGQQIPRALYQAVAEVLAYVYRLKNGRL